MAEADAEAKRHVGPDPSLGAMRANLKKLFNGASSPRDPRSLSEQPHLSPEAAVVERTSHPASRPLNEAGVRRSIFSRPNSFAATIDRYASWGGGSYVWMKADATLTEQHCVRSG